MSAVQELAEAVVRAGSTKRVLSPDGEAGAFDAAAVRHSSLISPTPLQRSSLLYRLVNLRRGGSLRWGILACHLGRSNESLRLSLPELSDGPDSLISTHSGGKLPIL